MSLLSDMRAYLQRLQAGSTILLAERTTLDREPLRRLLHAAIAEDSTSEPRLGRRLRHHLLTDSDALIAEFVQQVADLPGAVISGDLARSVALALRETLDRHGAPTRIEAADLTAPQRALIDHAGATAWAKYDERLARQIPSPRLYALELGLVRMVGDRPRLTPLGTTFLRLAGEDAAAWPIAIELLSAIDHDDPWRAHPSLAAHLLQAHTLAIHASDTHDEDLEGARWPWGNPVLLRWTDMGLLRHEVTFPGNGEPDPGESFTLTELGTRLLQDLLREPDAPIKSFARALLEDTSDVLLDVVPSRHGGAAASVVRHTRMLAHEMRNVLVPVRFAYDQLWARLPRDDVRVALHRQHKKITEGLDRALRFVTDAARAVSSFPAETTPFLAGPALEEACAAVTASTGANIALTIAGDAEEVRLRGPRPRLLMALINILRNAVQAGGPTVAIAASLRRADGYVAVLTLEDSGPGVPEALRDRLFENGHSMQTHGTGHGLSLVREVVEQDFSGSVHHETSHLGGARFVLRFPIPSEAT